MTRAFSLTLGFVFQPFHPLIRVEPERHTAPGCGGALARPGLLRGQVFLRKARVRLGDRGEGISPEVCPSQVKPGCVCVAALQLLPGCRQKQNGSAPAEEGRCRRG